MIGHRPQVRRGELFKILRVSNSKARSDELDLATPLKTRRIRRETREGGASYIKTLTGRCGM